MKRRALIIYCDSTISGDLTGPVYDNLNYRNFLMSNLGGAWYDHEIMSLENPTINQVLYVVRTFLANAHYTFIVFSGHGFIGKYDRLQYLEFEDGHMSLQNLKTSAYRQTLIVDACRGYYQQTNLLPRFISNEYGYFIGDIGSTRKIFDSAVMKADPGWTILFAASRGQTAMDTNHGGAYSLSLLAVAKKWEANDDYYNVFPLNVAHQYAKKVLYNNFYTDQVPAINNERRTNHFPLFVKQT